MRFAGAFGIGVFAQLFSLLSYSFLAEIWPQSSIKMFAVLVLIGGSFWAVQLLLRLSLWWRVAGLLALAMSAPLVALSTSQKAGEMLADPGYYSIIYAKGVGVASLGYVAAYLGLVFLAIIRTRARSGRDDAS